MVDKIKSAVEELAAKHQLSSRQQDVLYLMARGEGSDEISSILKLSPKTVKNHKNTLYTNLEVWSVQGALAKVIEVLGKEKSEGGNVYGYADPKGERAQRRC